MTGWFVEAGLPICVSDWLKWVYITSERTTLSLSISLAHVCSSFLSISTSSLVSRFLRQFCWCSEYITCPRTLSQWTKGFFESYWLTHWIINVTHVSTHTHWSPDCISKSFSSIRWCSLSDTILPWNQVLSWSMCALYYIT